MSELPNNDQSDLPKQSEAIQTELIQDGFFADISSTQAAVSVRVALRVRPLNARELHENSKVCVSVNKNSVILGKDR